MRIPTEAAGGIARAIISYRGKGSTLVTPATIEFKVPPSAAEVAEIERRNERIRTLERQLFEIEQPARIKELQKLGLRPPVVASTNIDEFAPTTARFVRFTILASVDGAEPCLDELELFAHDSSVNLARGKGVKTTASSLLPGHPIHQIQHLTDGRRGNSWSWISNQRGQGWAQIEFPEPTQIASVAWSRDAGTPAGYQDRVPVQYRIEVSLDGGNWITVSGHESRVTVQQLAAMQLPVLAPEQEKLRQQWTSELKKLRE